MPYIIDGHNLIPKIRGMSLQDLDDEARLIQLLSAYCQRTHKKVDVYFDRAYPGSAPSKNFGLVSAHFTRIGSTADEAIRLRLAQLKKSAKNWTVITSDHQVQAEARAAGAALISSDDFAEILLREISFGGPAKTPPTSEDKDISMWLKLFGLGESEEKH